MSPQLPNRPAGAASVLAYTPTLESLVLAEQLARGSSLTVIEGLSFSVRGWARERGASNLFTQQEVGLLDRPSPKIAATTTPALSGGRQGCRPGM